MTNTHIDTLERGDKRVWSKYNPSLVKRIDILLETSFLDSWKHDLDKENEGKVGQSIRISTGVHRLPTGGEGVVERSIQETGGIRQETLRGLRAGSSR